MTKSSDENMASRLNPSRPRLQARHVLGVNIIVNERGVNGWYSCNECGYELDVDYNAAKNISLKLLTVPRANIPRIEPRSTGSEVWDAEPE